MLNVMVKALSNQDQASAKIGLLKNTLGVKRLKKVPVKMLKLLISFLQGMANFGLVSEKNNLHPT